MRYYHCTQCRRRNDDYIIIFSYTYTQVIQDGTERPDKIKIDIYLSKTYEKNYENYNMYNKLFKIYIYV